MAVARIQGLGLRVLWFRIYGVFGSNKVLGSSKVSVEIKAAPVQAWSHFFKHSSVGRQRPRSASNLASVTSDTAHSAHAHALSGNSRSNLNYPSEPALDSVKMHRFSQSTEEKGPLRKAHRSQRTTANRRIKDCRERMNY